MTTHIGDHLFSFLWYFSFPANFTYKVKASQATTNGTSLQAWSPSMCDQELLLAVDVVSIDLLCVIQGLYGGS